jgi:hypothetical protein
MEYPTNYKPKDVAEHIQYIQEDMKNMNTEQLLNEIQKFFPEHKPLPWEEYEKKLDREFAEMRKQGINV